MKICVSYNLLIFLLVMLNLIQLFYKHLNIYLLDRALSGLPHSFSHFPILVSVHVVNQMKSNSIRISNRNRSSGSTDLFTALFRYRIDVLLHKKKTSSWSCALYNSFTLDLLYMKMNIAGNWTGRVVGSWVLYRGNYLLLWEERERERELLKFWYIKIYT